MSELDHRGVLSLRRQGGAEPADTVDLVPSDVSRVVLGAVLATNEVDARGRFHNRAELYVESPAPISGLRVEAAAPSVTALHLMPRRPSACFSGDSGVGEGTAFDNVQIAHGLVLVDVTSSEPESGIELEYQMLMRSDPGVGAPAHASD